MHLCVVDCLRYVYVCGWVLVCVCVSICVNTYMHIHVSVFAMFVCLWLCGCVCVYVYVCDWHVRVPTSALVADSTLRQYVSDDGVRMVVGAGGGRKREVSGRVK